MEHGFLKLDTLRKISAVEKTAGRGNFSGTRTFYFIYVRRNVYQYPRVYLVPGANADVASRRVASLPRCAPLCPVVLRCAPPRLAPPSLASPSLASPRLASHDPARGSWISGKGEVRARDNEKEKISLTRRKTSTHHRENHARESDSLLDYFYRKVRKYNSKGCGRYV